jgi:hypothetical protein
LLHGVPDLETITRIARAVQRRADSFAGPPLVGPSSAALGPFLLRVAGHRVATLRFDTLDQTLIVLALDPEPDPLAEPDEYEDDERAR